MQPPVPVALKKIDTYDEAVLFQAISDMLEVIEFDVPAGSKVLVKPNLVTPKERLAVTTPQFVRVLCMWLLERGAQVRVGDSPAFGTARKVAERTGLLDAISDLPVELVELGEPVSVTLPTGIRLGVSRHALEADTIVNCPRLKAHCQLGVTAGVKNLFGCVAGFRKAFAHCRYGDVGNLFESLIVDMIDQLPPGVTVVDAVKSMEETGPSGGRECMTRFSCASVSPVAADTVIYSIIGADMDILPLQREIEARELPGCRIDQTDILLDAASEVSCQFTLPNSLKPMTFHPLRLLKGRLKSLFLRL